jgi:hypothetical protein
VRKADSDRELYINEILVVKDKVFTEVMQRSLEKNFLGPKGGKTPSLLSIILKGRTVDFVVNPDDWSLLFHGLQILIHYHKKLTTTNG